MSLVSDAYDELVTRLTSLFPTASGYQRLSNAYDVEQNPITFLDQGWGIAAGGSTNTNRNLCSMVTSTRTWTVVLTRALDATDSDDTLRDTNTKLILEDARTVVNSFEREVRLDDLNLNCRFISDSGLETISPDDGSILVMRLNFEVEAFDAP
jgi:hypothetical protein